MEITPRVTTRGRAVAAIAADGICAVLTDRTVIRIAGGRTLTDASAVVAAAVLDEAVWLVTEIDGKHALHRFDTTGTPTAPPTALGALGDDVAIAAARSGARVALVEGERGVVIRDHSGELELDLLGERGRDRHLLLGARGVFERRGAALVPRRSGAGPALVLPADLAGAVVAGGGPILDYTAALVEVIARGYATALVYDLRRGELRSRIRLGDARVLAISERGCTVVIGHDRHIALLDVRAGTCVSERVLPAATCAAAIDATGDAIVVVDVDGHGGELSVAAEVTGETEAVEPAVAEAESAKPSAPPRPSAPPPPSEAPLEAAALLRLRGLGGRRRPTFGGTTLVSYLDDTRSWIASLCALAAATGDAAAETERAAAAAFARWRRRGAPHVELARELGLGPIAASVLLLVAAPQIWGELARDYARASADPARPLVDELLLAHLLGAGTTTRAAIGRELDADAPLIRSGAISIGRGLRPYAALTAHPAIARRLAGAALAGDAEPAPPARPLADVIGPTKAIVALVRALAMPAREPVRVVVRGRPGSGRRTLAAALAAQAGRGLGLVAVSSASATIRQRLHDVALRGDLPCVTVEDAGNDPVARAELRAILDGHAGPLFIRAPIGGELPIAPGHLAIELPPASETERAAAWRAILGTHGLDPGVADALAARFTVGPGAIVRACAAVANHEPGPALEAALAGAVRQHRSARIEAIATRVDRLATWSDLIVPDDIGDALHELIARVRHRRTVLEAWGMDQVAATAQGVTALFQGGPGTGKTMAAGVVAAELGHQLWRVDLSRVASKWVGETEKNLAAVFDAAEEGEIVLLFDEADSLFARRTDVRSSHDKNANLETNFLLQRLDSFTGIAILTTNFGVAIDPAFKRRLSVQIQFPFPDEGERERLWRAHLPPTLPVSGELDLAGLAQRYQLSGGYIRNAALRAAYLAADRGGVINQAQLELAVRAIYRDRCKLTAGGAID